MSDGDKSGPDIEARLEEHQNQVRDLKHDGNSIEATLGNLWYKYHNSKHFTLKGDKILTEKDLKELENEFMKSEDVHNMIKYTILHYKKDDKETIDLSNPDNVKSILKAYLGIDFDIIHKKLEGKKLDEVHAEYTNLVKTVGNNYFEQKSEDAGKGFNDYVQDNFEHVKTYVHKKAAEIGLEVNKNRLIDTPHYAAGLSELHTYSKKGVLQRNSQYFKEPAKKK